jgi:NAD(P)-dependent dehydrogenase (short-subunit alcohol dehydrogenase family)
VKEIQAIGRQSYGHAADVSKLSEVEGLIEASVKHLGPLNVMIANAGIAQVKALLDLTEDDVRRMFEVNVFGVFNCYSAGAKQMIKQSTGGKLVGCARYVSCYWFWGSHLLMREQYRCIQTLCNAFSLFGFEMGGSRFHSSFCNGDG